MCIYILLLRRCLQLPARFQIHAPFHTTLSVEVFLAKSPSCVCSHTDNLHSPAFIAKSLGDENRLRILLLLSDGKKSVSSIVESLELSQPLVSHHLKELRRALLVNVERKGPFVYYELADPEVLTIISDLNTVALKLLKNRQTF